MRLSALTRLAASLCLASSFASSVTLAQTSQEIELADCENGEAYTLQWIKTGDILVSGPEFGSASFRPGNDETLYIFQDYSLGVDTGAHNLRFEIPDYGVLDCLLRPKHEGLPRLQQAYQDRLNAQNKPGTLPTPKVSYPVAGQSYGGIVRSGPGFGYPRIASLAENTPLSILAPTGQFEDQGAGTDYQWFQIRMPNGRVAYQWGGIMCNWGTQPLPGMLADCATGY